MNTMTHSEEFDTAWAMREGYGSFASTIASAYFAADGDNRKILLSAFDSLFQRVYSHQQSIKTKA
mgnify:FL=1